MVWEKEAYAVRWALLTWRHFLEGGKEPFEVWSDHKNLEALTPPTHTKKTFTQTSEMGAIL